MNITDSEWAVIRAIRESEYGEDPTDETWTKFVAEDAKLKPGSFPGVMASLVKKGLAKVGHLGDEEATCALTEAGAALYKERTGKL